MCRLLLLHDPAGLNPADFLPGFRQLSRDSREYQGHGWGCAWLDTAGRWQQYHDIRPVWEDDGPVLAPTRLFLAHARSAFRDEGIAVENNMPFGDENRVFLFNGELQGVRIKAQGRIGAEKIFNTILRLDHGDLAEAVRRGTRVIDHRTRYIRAMNFFLASTDAVHICSWFGEDPDYFQLKKARIGDTLVICSAALPDREARWQPLANRTIETLTLH